MLAERETRRVHLPDHAGVRIAPPLVYAIALFVGLVLHWVRPIEVALDERVVVFRPIGVGLVVVGGWMVVEAVRLMRSVGTSPLPTRPTTVLVLGGPFHYTRNPMYLGMLLVTAGVALLANAVWPLLFLPIVVSIINSEVIVREEKYLSRKFGGEYEVYKRRTRRWL